MAHDVADMSVIPRAPKGREEVPVQISRLMHAHEIVLKEVRTMARLATQGGDDGINDLIVSGVIRRTELASCSSRTSCRISARSCRASELHG